MPLGGHCLRTTICVCIDAHSDIRPKVLVYMLVCVKALSMMLKGSGSKLAQVSATKSVFDLCVRCQARSVLCCSLR